MKIGKSVVNFSLTASSGCQYTSLADVPYWSLYSRPGDCVQEDIGNQWRSDRALTFAELKQYLERYPGRRLLNAYPRKSLNIRISYAISKRGNNIDIFSKWTGEIYATFAIENGTLHNTYLQPDAPSPLSYYRKLAMYNAWQHNLVSYETYLGNLPCKANL